LDNTGSTRLRAGTATKLVLNMISTTVVVKLGYVYGNLMVNVQPANAKLEECAMRISQGAAGASSARVTELLDRSGHNMRTGLSWKRESQPRSRRRNFSRRMLEEFETL
jgi:N-acetylmuramic acid 6-phosphate etherase